MTSFRVRFWRAVAWGLGWSVIAVAAACVLWLIGVFIGWAWSQL